MRFKAWLVASLLACSVAGLYTSKILEAQDKYMDTTPGGLKAQMWDMYPRWLGARELLLHGRNPYGPDVTHEIQIAYYGHIVTQDYPESGHKIIDEQRFAYPVYVIFLMAPTIYADFRTVYRWAPLVLGLLAGLCVPLCQGMLRWRLPFTASAAITLFTVSSPQIVQGMRHQQLAIVVGLTLISGLWCVCRNRLGLGGMILAWSTIKPQMALFPLCFFLAWILGDWHARRRLLIAFSAALAVLIGAGEVILPGWIHDFALGALAYQWYFPTTSLLRVALGERPGEILGGIILGILMIYAWTNRKEAPGSPRFITVFAAFLMGTVVVFPLFTPFNQVLLILPAMILLRDWKLLPGPSRSIFIIFVSWPWIFEALLLVFPPRLDSTSRKALLPLLLVSFFPLLLPALMMNRRRTSILDASPAEPNPA